MSHSFGSEVSLQEYGEHGFFKARRATAQHQNTPNSLI